ncbi:MAG: TatD family hydrolase [Lachnospiraceae bacterium]|nr:TatD family hydrolase [Lachnospiraceae bacterium]
MIFETHAHYDDDRYDEDRFTLIPEIHRNGVDVIIDVGASIQSTKKAMEISERFEYVYAAVGVHPSDIADLNEKTYLWLKEQTQKEKVVAVGEIGLDYYWDKEEDVQKTQRYWFKRQIELAKEVKLPIIIHSRDAANDTITCMREAGAKDVQGVVHCYSYSPELAREFLAMGYHIGVGGVVTFKNSKKLKETVKSVPIERILLETDSPYMTPEPHRGERNRSDYIVHVANTIAELKGMDVNDVYRITTENARKLFPKVK